MPLLTRLYDFVAGTIIASQQVDDEFNQILANLTEKTIHVNTTTVGNIGASGPDDLMSYTIPAGTLKVNGDHISILAAGQGANNANAKTVRVNYAGNALDTIALTTATGRIWRIRIIIIRTSATTALVYIELQDSNAGGATTTVLYDRINLSVAATHANANVVKIESTVSTADNDITQNLMVVKLTNL